MVPDKAAHLISKQMKDHLMAKSKFTPVARLSSAIILGLVLAQAPALAEKGGNGGGNQGGGNSHSESLGGGNANHGKSTAAQLASAAKKADDTSTVKVKASAFGKLNGFLHASPTAIAHAAPNSAIGKVVAGYGGLLKTYLEPADGTTPPTAEDLAAALEAAANKPLTADVVAAINAKLIASSPDLANSLTQSGKTIDDVNGEIAAAL